MSNIFISNFLKKSINAYNDNKNNDTLDALRGALIGYINGDPEFKTNGFDEAIKYTISQGIKESELFEDFDSSKEIENDKSKWTKKYFIQQIVYLEDNFCRKRINHIKEVAKYIYRDSDNSLNDKSTSSSLSLLKNISSYINAISKSESSIIKEIQSLKKNDNIDMKNVTKAVTYIEKQYNLVLKYYTNKFKSIVKE